MKKTRSDRKETADSDDLKPEYDFDYTKAKPNRFAVGIEKRLAVLLDADVAEVFHTSDEVNKALRALIAAMPRQMPHAESELGKG